MSDTTQSQETQQAVMIQPPSGLTVLSLLSILTGVVVGAVCGTFRLLLEHAAGLRTALVLDAPHPFPAGLMMIAIGSITAFIAAWMVRRLAPLASGSGIPHVEAVLAGLNCPGFCGDGTVIPPFLVG
ncbi:hypothetical protein [Acetobacter pasteurianus]|uniref:hypothetical protein n=1 Tax=Acetobacter pasteurianus TaxID=438 RepID=UPI00056F4C71|nr:hypothetical protein [Acetobacter pasteurianus]